MKKFLTILLLLTLCVAVFASCGDNKPAGSDSGLTEAGDYLFSLYKNDSEVTPSDFEVVGKVMVGTTAYTVEWSVDVAEGVTIKESSNAGFFIVDVNEKTPTEIAYTLTATIKSADGKTVQKSFSRKIPAYKVFTYAEYAAAADDTALVVEGIVTGIFSKSNGSSANGLYMQDLNNEGGYYVYGMTQDPAADLGIKVGMTVIATGVKDTYNGTYEVINATVEISDSTVKTVTPVDYTEVFSSAAELTDAALVGKQSMLVTIKGVEITTQDVANGYYKFKLGDKETYIRISSSNNCISKDEIETFKAGHTDHAVWNANVTGIVSLYSGSFYLIPATVDAFEYLNEVQKTDAEKVEIEMETVDVLKNATEDTVVTLPLVGTKYEDVKFAWALAENACATLDATTGKLTITLPEEATKITLTLTVTCGETTATYTYDIEVDAQTTDYYIPEKVETLEVNKPFKLTLFQTNLGEYLYFTGTVADKDYYLASSNKAEKAVDVYLEAVEGVENAYRMYFLAGETKTYIEVYERSAGEAGKGSGSLRLVTETPETYFTYDADLGLLVVKSADGNNAYYLGTYKTYNTFSVSNTAYISGDKAADVGKSQFPAQLSTLVPAVPAPEKVETLEVNKPFKLTLFQANLGEYLYFTGTVADKDYYLAASNKVEKAVDVYLEAVEGVENAYRMYFYAGETKTYIEVYERSAGEAGKGSGSLRLVTETPETYFTYDADLGLLVVKSADGNNSYYLGTYKTYNTFSVSNTAYISGDKAADVGKSQFPAVLSTIVLKKAAYTPVTELKADTAYKLTLNQANLGLYLNFAGTVADKDYYLAATDKISKAVDVYLEAVEGVENAYRMYFYAGADKTKTYIEVYERSAGEAGKGSGSLRLVTETPETYFTYDADLGLLIVKSADGNNAYYLGTYKTYNTFSVSNTAYITGDKAADVGKSQFPAQLVIIGAAE